MSVVDRIRSVGIVPVVRASSSEEALAAVAVHYPELRFATDDPYSLRDISRFGIKVEFDRGAEVQEIVELAF